MIRTHFTSILISICSVRLIRMLLLISLLRLLIQEPCLLEVDQQTGSTILLAYISHVLVHSSCQLFTVIRDGINSFDASPPPTSSPYRDYYTHPNNRFFFTSYQTRQSKGNDWGKNRIMIITSLFKDTRNQQKSFFSTNFFHFSCFAFLILCIYFYFIFIYFLPSKFYEPAAEV